MRALVYEAPYRVRVREKPVPAVEHPDDVVLRVTRAAICGSDLHLFHGLVPDTRVGTTFGHEFTGVVEETGPGVRGLRRGDRVVVPFNIACGTCFYCLRGLTGRLREHEPVNASSPRGVYGYSHTTGGYDGGQAEYVRVPFADVGPMKIPDDIDGRGRAPPQRRASDRLPGGGDGRDRRGGHRRRCSGAGRWGSPRRAAPGSSGRGGSSRWTAVECAAAHGRALRRRRDPQPRAPSTISSPP